MQDDFDYWFDMAKCLFAGEYGKIDYEKGEKTVEMLLKFLLCFCSDRQSVIQP